MKRLAIRLCLLMIVVILLPYLLTSYMTVREEQKSQDEIKDETLQYDKDGNKLSLEIEDYVAGVTAASVTDDYETELLKAQAVVIRTLVTKSLHNNAEEKKDTGDIISLDENSFTFYDEDQFKDIIGEDSDALYGKIIDAVESTAGEIMYYNNELITPLFHSVSSGNTREASEVLGEGYPYLKRIACTEDADSPDYNKISEHAMEDILEILEEKYPKNGLTEDNFYENLIILERDTSGYVKKAAVGNLTASGEELADVLNINSSNFYFQDFEGKVRIICKGKGHGFGMSQFCANEKAKAGMEYKEILKYFYSDIKIDKIK